MSARPGVTGFTLLELLVVLVITGVAVTMALPAIDRGEMRLHSATREAASRLMAAQRTAVLQQHDVAVAIDTVRRVLWLHDDRNSNGVLEDGEEVVEHEITQGVRFGRAAAPAGQIGGKTVTFSNSRDGMPVIVFHRNGSASEWGGFYLSTDGNSGPIDAAVLIDRATGRAWTLTFNGDAWVTND